MNKTVTSIVAAGGIAAGSGATYVVQDKPPLWLPLDRQIGDPVVGDYDQVRVLISPDGWMIYEDRNNPFLSWIAVPDCVPEACHYRVQGSLEETWLKVKASGFGRGPSSWASAQNTP